MGENMDKSLLFITLSALCVWLIVDVALGKNYLGNFLGTIFPFMSGNTASMTTEEVERAKENAPASSAIGSGFGDTSGRANGNYSTNGQIIGDSYRKN